MSQMPQTAAPTADPTADMLRPADELLADQPASQLSPSERLVAEAEKVTRRHIPAGEVFSVQHVRMHLPQVISRAMTLSALEVLVRRGVLERSGSDYRRPDAEPPLVERGPGGEYVDRLPPAHFDTPLPALIPRGGAIVIAAIAGAVSLATGVAIGLSIAAG